MGESVVVENWFGELKRARNTLESEGHDALHGERVTPQPLRVHLDAPSRFIG